MSTKAPQNRLYVRPSPEARHALQRLLTELQAPSRFGPDLTQEDMVAATWLWMAGMPEQVAEAIRPHLEAVRAWRASAKEGAATEPHRPDVVGRPGIAPESGRAIKAVRAQPEEKRRKGAG